MKMNEREHTTGPSQPDRAEFPQEQVDTPVVVGAIPLVVEGLNKRYRGGALANHDITLSANRGEILGILGPNGAGKTTLVRQITTELLPTSGRILVLGHDVVAEALTVEGLLGVVPQEADLFEYLDVYQHLRIFGKLRGLSAKSSAVRAEELVEGLRLDEHRSMPVEKLSGGLKRRLLIGIAAIARPPIMVLDEPTTGLDPRSRRDLWALLRRHKEQGATILLTTHYMEEAESLCDRVGIIHKGRLLALDTVANLQAIHGYQYKVTYTCNGSTEEAEPLYGSDDRELVERARAMGASQYTVARTNLEDVYLALTGEKESLDGNAN